MLGLKNIGNRNFVLNSVKKLLRSEKPMKIKYAIMLCFLVIAMFPTAAFAFNFRSIEKTSLGVKFARDESIGQMRARFVSSVDDNSCYSVNSAIRKIYYDDDFFMLGLGIAGEILPFSSTPRLLHHVNRHFPFEFLERVNDELLYAAYKIQSEDMVYYKYLFFRLLENHTPSKQESWILTGQTFTISQPLSFADFSSIQVGSTMSDVAKIEPLATARRPFRYLNDYIPPRVTESWNHITGEYEEIIIPSPEIIEYTDYFYLTDGILQISFRKPNDPKVEFIVTNIDFKSGFNVPILGDASRFSEIEAKILPKDFPDSLIRAES